MKLTVLGPTWLNSCWAEPRGQVGKMASSSLETTLQTCNVMIKPWLCRHYDDSHHSPYMYQYLSHSLLINIEIIKFCMFYISQLLLLLSFIHSITHCAYIIIISYFNLFSVCLIIFIIFIRMKYFFSQIYHEIAHLTYM